VRASDPRKIAQCHQILYLGTDLADRYRFPVRGVYRHGYPILDRVSSLIDLHRQFLTSPRHASVLAKLSPWLLAARPVHCANIRPRLEPRSRATRKSKRRYGEEKNRGCSAIFCQGPKWKKNGQKITTRAKIVTNSPSLLGDSGNILKFRNSRFGDSAA
ncbi:hypothetical protein BaRGS_00025150, partial [Batillaria attramentaria]